MKILFTQKILEVAFKEKKISKRKKYPVAISYCYTKDTAPDKTEKFGGLLFPIRMWRS